MIGAARDVVVACALAAAVAGCGGSDGVVATFTERDTEIRVEADDRFAIRLPSNPSTGYEWKVTKLPAILLLVDSHFDGPAEPRPGAGGHQVLEFRALRAGDTTLELDEIGPAQPSAPLTKPLTFEVTVR